MSSAEVIEKAASELSQVSLICIILGSSAAVPLPASASVFGMPIQILQHFSGGVGLICLFLTLKFALSVANWAIPQLFGPATMFVDEVRSLHSGTALTKNGVNVENSIPHNMIVQLRSVESQSSVLITTNRFIERLRSGMIIFPPLVLGVAGWIITLEDQSVFIHTTIVQMTRVFHR